MTSQQSWRTRLWNWLRPILDSLLRHDPTQFLVKLLNSWDTLSRLWDKVHYHGMYEILDYDSTLEIIDPKGERAILSRREVIRFLQNNVVAIHDHAWGDGNIFADYHCQPGIPVDFYEDGSKHNILISLRETKDRGDVIELRVERVIENGLVKNQEWLETEIDHWMKHLKLSIIFPQERPCQRATLSRRSTGKTIPLPRTNFASLPSGKQKLTWETNSPKLHDLYTIKWTW